MNTYIHTYIHTYIQSYKYVFAGFGLASIVPKKCFTVCVSWRKPLIFFLVLGVSRNLRGGEVILQCCCVPGPAILPTGRYTTKKQGQYPRHFQAQSSVAWSARWGGETSPDSWKLARSSAQPRFLSLWWRNILTWESVSCASCSADTKNNPLICLCCASYSHS